MPNTRAIIDVSANTRQAEKQIESIFAKERSLRLNDQFSRPLGKITGSVSEFNKSLEASNSRVLAFGLSASVLYGITRGFQEMVRATIEVDKALKEINVILGESSSGLQKFSNELFNVAKLTGQSFNVAAEAAKEFSRQGLGVEQTLSRTRSALILTRLSGLEVKDSVEALTAALNSFGKEALTDERIINSLANVDAKFAVSSADLAEAIKRTGSVASGAGVSFNELIGIVTAVKQTTAREGSVIGNAFKTIFTKISNPEVIAQLDQAGVSVRNLSGATLPTLKILENLAKEYDGLSESTKFFLEQNIAGLYQINQFKAALTDLSKVNSVASQATRVAAQETNEATLRNLELNKSLDALVNKTLVNLKKIGSEVGGVTIAPLLGNFLGGVNNVLEKIDIKKADGVGEKLAKGFVEGFGQYISGSGLILIGALAAKFIKKFIDFAARSLKETTELNKAASDQLHLQREISNTLLRHPELLKNVLSGQKSVLTVEREILSTLRLQTEQRAIAEQISKTAASKAVSGGFSINKDGNLIVSQPGKKVRPGFADGFIPEVIGALQGGYIPGDIKETYIPGIGNVTYNSKEKIKNIPGMAQPAILPPQNSKAGAAYRKEFEQTHGFNPYIAAEGFVPSFSKKDIERTTASNQYTTGENTKIKRILDSLARRYAKGEITINEANTELSKLSKEYKFTAETLRKSRTFLVEAKNKAIPSKFGEFFQKESSGLFDPKSLAPSAVQSGVQQLNVGIPLPSIVPKSALGITELQSQRNLEEQKKLRERKAEIEKTLSQQETDRISKEVEEIESTRRREAELAENVRKQEAELAEKRELAKKTQIDSINKISNDINKTISEAASANLAKEVDAMEAARNASKLTKEQKYALVKQTYLEGSETDKGMLQTSANLFRSLKPGPLGQEVSPIAEATDKAIATVERANLRDEEQRELRERKRQINERIAKQEEADREKSRQLQREDEIFAERERRNAARQKGSGITPADFVVYNNRLASEMAGLKGATRETLQQKLDADERAKANLRLGEIAARFEKAAFGLSLAAPIAGQTISQFVGGEDRTGRVAKAGISGVTDTISLAATGAIIGSAQGPAGILPGAAVGAAIGGINGLINIFDEMNTNLPELTRTLERLQSSLNSTINNLNAYSDATGKLNQFQLGNINLSKQEVNNLKRVQSQALSTIEPRDRIALAGAKTETQLQQVKQNIIESKNQEIRDQGNKILIDEFRKNFNAKTRSAKGVSSVLGFSPGQAPRTDDGVVEASAFGTLFPTSDTEDKAGRALKGISNSLVNDFFTREGDSSLRDFFLKNPEKALELEKSRTNPKSFFALLRQAGEGSGNKDLSGFIDDLLKQVPYLENNTATIPEFFLPELRPRNLAQEREGVEKREKEASDKRIRTGNYRSFFTRLVGNTKEEYARTSDLESKQLIDSSFQRELKSIKDANELEFQKLFSNERELITLASDENISKLRESLQEKLEIMLFEMGEKVRGAVQDAVRNSSGTLDKILDLDTLPEESRKEFFEKFQKSTAALSVKGQSIRSEQDLNKFLGEINAELARSQKDKDTEFEKLTPAERILLNGEIDRLQALAEELKNTQLGLQSSRKKAEQELDVSQKLENQRVIGQRRLFDITERLNLGGGVRNLLNPQDTANRIYEANLAGRVDENLGLSGASSRAFSLADIYKERGLQIPPELRGELIKLTQDAIEKSGVKLRGEETSRSVATEIIENQFKASDREGELPKARGTFELNLTRQTSESIKQFERLSDFLSQNSSIYQEIITKNQLALIKESEANTQFSLIVEKLNSINAEYLNTVTNIREINNQISSVKLETQKNLKQIFSDEYAAGRQQILEEGIRTGRVPNKQTGELERYSPVKAGFESFFNELEYTVKDLYRDLNRAAVELGQTMKSSFKSAFKDFITGAASAEDALRGLGLSIADKLLDKSLDATTNILFNALGAVGSSVGSSFTRRNMGGPIKKYATGGLVTGGSGVKDDVPALLTDGEYVLNKDAVNYYGVDYVSKLNRGSSFNQILDNRYAYDDPKRPNKGEFIIDPRLSEEALDDTNNPQNEIRMQREEYLLNYLMEKKAYEDAKRKSLKDYDRGQRNALIGGIVNAGIAVAGAGVGSYFGRAGAGAGAASTGVQAYKGATGNVVTTGRFTNVGMSYSNTAAIGGGTTVSGSGFRNLDTSLGNQGISLRNMGGPISKYDRGGGPMMGGDVPALLTGGEYVLDKNTSKQLGRNYLDKLNNKQIKKYAQGGGVSSISYSKPQDINPLAAVETNNVNLEKLISINEEIKSLLKEKSNNKTSQEEGGSSSGTIAQTNYVTISINVSKSGETTAETSTESTVAGQKPQNDDIEKSKKLSELIKSNTLQILDQESRPGGFLDIRFRKN